MKLLGQVLSQFGLFITRRIIFTIGVLISQSTRVAFLRIISFLCGYRQRPLQIVIFWEHVSLTAFITSQGLFAEIQYVDQ